MQKLTRRGMILAQKFRAIGIPVIESYPGAAQDILSIPRKQAGLEYLVQGLKEFGLTGNFTDENISHDELDAVKNKIAKINDMKGDLYTYLAVRETKGKIEGF